MRDRCLEGTCNCKPRKPKPRPDKPEPQIPAPTRKEAQDDACRWCSTPKEEHLQRWSEYSVGWHAWTERIDRE